MATPKLRTTRAAVVPPLIMPGDPDIPSGSIEDHVWQDSDGNGIQDEGEVGVSGADITLLDSGGKVLDRTISDAAVPTYSTIANTAHTESGSPTCRVDGYSLARAQDRIARKIPMSIRHRAIAESSVSAIHSPT